MLFFLLSLVKGEVKSRKPSSSMCEIFIQTWTHFLFFLCLFFSILLLSTNLRDGITNFKVLCVSTSPFILICLSAQTSVCGCGELRVCVCSTASWGNAERNGVHGLLRFSSLNGCSCCFTINSHWFLWPWHAGERNFSLPWHLRCLSVLLIMLLVKIPSSCSLNILSNTDFFCQFRSNIQCCSS